MPKCHRTPDVINIGPKSAAMLASVGITTLDELRRRGAVPAYLQVKQQHHEASLNLLYALAGAIENVDWKIIQRERKSALLMELEIQEQLSRG